MELSLPRLLVPPHIDGVIIHSDLRPSRFFSSGSTEEASAPHRRELALHLGVGGTARFLVDGRHVRLQANSLLWIRPRQSYLLIDASRGFSAWLLVFRTRCVRRVCTHPRPHPLLEQGGSEVMLRRLPAPRARGLASLYADVPVGAGRDVFNAGLAYALARSWHAYHEASQAILTSEVHPAVRKAAWLLRDLDAPLDNTSLAERCGLSPQRLSRLFKRQMGTPLSEFRNRQRLERFLARLHEAPDANLMQLALEVGFGSYAQFHRVFKQHMGPSPARFRRHAMAASMSATAAPSGVGTARQA